MSRKKEENALYAEMLHCLEKLEEAMKEVQDPDKKQSLEEAVTGLQDTLNSLSKGLEHKSASNLGMSSGSQSSSELTDEDE